MAMTNKFKTFDHEGWKPIEEYDYQSAWRMQEQKYFELSNGLGRRAIARYEIIDHDDDGDPIWDWQRKRPDAIDGDNLGFEPKAFRAILTLEDPAMQNAITCMKEELTAMKREHGGIYTVAQIASLLDKYFPNWYVKDIGLPGITMTELQDKMEISFKFEFNQR